MTFMVGKYEWYYLVPFAGFALSVRAQGLSWSAVENVFLYAGIGFFFAHFALRAEPAVLLGLVTSIPAEYLIISKSRGTRLSRRFRWENYTLSNYLIGVSYALEFLLSGILLGLL